MQNNCIYINELNLIRQEYNLKAVLCCGHFTSMENYYELTQYLNTHEHNYYDTLLFERRIKSYLIGRFVAKQAVSALTGEEKLSEIIIKSGVFTQPIVVSKKQNIQVSITHCDDYGAAIAFPEAHPMGIDLEKIDINRRGVLEKQITNFEKEEINSLPISYDAWLTLLWTAKEALSKIFKTGLMTSFEIYEIARSEVYDNFIMCYYKNFPQYKVLSFFIGSYMFSMAYPIKTELYFDIPSLQDCRCTVSSNKKGQ